MKGRIDSGKEVIDFLAVLRFLQGLPAAKAADRSAIVAWSRSSWLPAAKAADRTAQCIFFDSAPLPAAEAADRWALLGMPAAAALPAAKAADRVMCIEHERDTQFLPRERLLSTPVR